MTPRDLAPQDAELIAAFVDKRLSEEERQAFLERLDKDEALYEVFVETVRYRDQASAEGGKVLEPSAWREKWMLPVAVAALLSLAVATPLLMSKLSKESYAEALVAGGRLDPYLVDGWYEQPWSEMRGGAERGDEAKIAFRLGVRVVDLEVAFRSRRSTDARNLVRRIEDLLRELEFSEPLGQLYSELEKRLEQDGLDAQMIEAAGEHEARLLEFLADFESHYELGKLCELGKLAATSEDADFLTERSFARSLSRLEEDSWPNPVEAELGKISRTLRSNDGEGSFSTLRASFASVVERF